jgi:competence protein ComEA
MKLKRTFAIILAIAVVVVLAMPSWAGDKEKININTATVDQLIQLKGIGNKYAARIIEYREKNGPFDKLEDIMKVKGIGPKTFETIKDMITIE